MERLQNNVLSSLYPDVIRNSPQVRRKYLNQTTPRGSIKGSPAVLPSSFDRSIRSSNLSLSHRAENGRLPSRAELEPLVDSDIHWLWWKCEVQCMMAKWRVSSMISLNEEYRTQINLSVEVCRIKRKMESFNGIWNRLFKWRFGWYKQSKTNIVKGICIRQVGRVHLMNADETNCN